MRIGVLARRSGVSERSLRYYEQQGLLTPLRTPGGHRDYPESAVDRVALIQRLFAAGLCSSKIAQLLPCMRDNEHGSAASASSQLAADLARERKRLDRMIADLVQSREVLDEVIASASGGETHTPTARTS